MNPNMIMKLREVDIILTLELTKSENVMKERCFQFLSRILTFTLMKLNLILKKLPIEIILTLESTKCQNMMKKPCFEFLSKI